MSMNSSQNNYPSITKFHSSGGADVFRIPLPEFPFLWGNAYLVITEDENGRPICALIDSGSGLEQSNQYLDAGLIKISEMIGKVISVSSLTHILITHGHIDHFGGLCSLRPRTQALIGIHELDQRNLTRYEERITVVANRLNAFLIDAGVQDERREFITNMYMTTKSLFHSIPVQFTYEKCGMKVGPFEFLHVPGHCAGHVVIRLDNILFSGDHILEKTSPHQSPESLTHYTGLGHYLESLNSLQNWIGGSNPLLLGGHESEIYDVVGRIAEIRLIHQQRLEKLSELLRKSATIAETSFSLFGEVHGYNILLALEETGAHVEYLYQRGALEIFNLSDLEGSTSPRPIYYRIN